MIFQPRVLRHLWLWGQLLVKTYLLLLVVRLGLWMVPFPKLRAWVQARGQKPGLSITPEMSEQASPPAQGWQMAVWAIEKAARYSPGQTKCLARALVAQILLQRRGYQPILQLGVKKLPTGTIHAHAWVELNSQVVIGGLDNLADYSVLRTPEARYS
jgi:hypothetical protein